MNSVAHCGGVYLRDIVEEKCRFRPTCRKLSGLSREKTRITPRLSQTSGAQQRKNTDYAPACRKLPGLNREKTWITPRLSQTSGAQQRKNTNYAPLVGSFRGSTEEKHELRPACRKLPGLNREKTWITPRLSQTSGAQQRKNMDYAPLVTNFRGSTEKNVDYRAFRNVGYNKCRDAHRGRMFRLLWTFVDLKLPSAMSHAIHKIVSKERCQSYFISRRLPHLGISKDSELCTSAHRCLHYAYARLCFRNSLVKTLLLKLIMQILRELGIFAVVHRTVDDAGGPSAERHPPGSAAGLPPSPRGSLWHACFPHISQNRDSGNPQSSCVRSDPSASI